MEIKAKSKFNSKAMRAVAHLTMFKKANPKKKMIFWAIVYSILLAVAFLEIILFDKDLLLLVCGGLLVLIYLLFCCLYFVLPKIQYASLGDMKEAENEYIFYDDYVKEYTKAENYNAEADIQYDIFKKIYETGEYLFLYKNNAQVYIVEKSTIENGTVGELRSKLMSCVGDKYYMCKY